MRLSEPSAEANRRRRRVVAVLLGGLLLGLALSGRYLRPADDPQSDAARGSGTLEPASGAFTTLPAAGSGSDSETGGAPEVGKSAPDFTLKTLDGGEITLSDVKGTAVLINFWASWCPPCRLEMPDLVRSYERYKDQGFVILGVDLTFQDALADVQDFVQEFNISYPILLDETGEVTLDNYRLIGLPMSVFVDREGIVRRMHIGAMTAQQIDEYVQEIVQ